MITWLKKKIFGTSYERALRRMTPKIAAINDLEAEMKKLSDTKLRAKTAEFREKLDNGMSLNDLVVPAFAVCREASVRTLKMRHHDFQLLGGMVLHEGGIAEMRTGDGKTLMASLPAYLNALENKGVHVVTLNDYLVKRDAESMGKIYGLLGMTTGTVVIGDNPDDRPLAYRCDITYAHFGSLALELLSDRLKLSEIDRLRPLNYAIVDEADSILLDEAFTPLIIEGRGVQEKIAVPNLFRRYPKLAGMTSTAEIDAVELRSIYALECVSFPTHKPVIRVDHGDLIYKTKREKFTAFVDDVLDKHRKERPILIGAHNVDECTVISDILTKEGIDHEVLRGEDHEHDSLVMALAGRKGAITIATPWAGQGVDIILGGNPEMLARRKLEKQSSPIDASLLWKNPEMFAKKKLEKQDMIPGGEAFNKLVDELSAECTREGAEVCALGGLYVIGTERNGSRRVDDQLRGRAGRQGDPGDSMFYASCEDDLMQFFAGDRLRALMEKMGMPDGEPIDHPWVRKSFVNAQKRWAKLRFDKRMELLDGPSAKRSSGR